MRELHVVAVSEDGRYVVLASSKGATKGSHQVRLDARLLAAARGELGADTGHDLSPKEIQARLRAGESAEQIATSAGMTLSRVERFAGPVAGELARTIDQAREAFVVRGRLGRSAVSLGAAVDAALAEHARPDSVVWTTRREEDGRWRVQVDWTARGRARSAAWFFEPHRRLLEAVDPTSAALAHVDANPAPVRRAAAKPSVKKQVQKPVQKPVKKPAVKPTAKRPAAAKPAAKPATKPATKTATKPATKTATKTATKPATKTATKTAATKATKSPAKLAAKASRPRLRVVPDPPAVTSAPASRKRSTPAKRSAADEREGVKVRASVPGWADVLLGTTPSGEK